MFHQGNVILMKKFNRQQIFNLNIRAEKHVSVYSFSINCNTKTLPAGVSSES